jgi:hypothetical protein
MLNDLKAPQILNSRFGTSCFKYLPDPIVPIKDVIDIDVRKEYGIPYDSTLLLHPGGMWRYKATVEILKALSLLDESVRTKIAVIFAGRVTSEIESEFRELIESIGNSIKIVVIEGFISFEKLGALFRAADWILIPYKIKSQSSGILGHAVNFKKPVISVSNSLIGNIVEKYKLGINVPEADACHIKECLEHLPQWHYSPNDYMDSHSIGSFCECIIKA